MIKTPVNLELLLHCYYSPEPHPRIHAPAMADGAAYLLSEGMITLSHDKPNVYHTTGKGEAYIQYLLTVPFPELTWKMP